MDRLEKKKGSSYRKGEGKRKPRDFTREKRGKQALRLGNSSLEKKRRRKEFPTAAALEEEPPSCVLQHARGKKVSEMTTS